MFVVREKLAHRLDEPYMFGGVAHQRFVSDMLNFSGFSDEIGRRQCSGAQTRFDQKVIFASSCRRKDAQRTQH